MSAIQTIYQPEVIRRGVEAIEFHSVEDALACARIPNLPLFLNTLSKSGQGSGNAIWSGCETFAEATELAEVGWPEGLAKAEAMRAQLCGVIGSRSERPRLSRSVAGFAPCVPAALAGDPESMFSTRKIMVSSFGKVVTIVYNNCVSAGISADVLMLRGAICLALVDALEACGFRCEIQIGCGFSSLGETPRREIYLTLKEPDSVINSDTLAYWLVHPAAFRRIVIAITRNVWAEGCARIAPSIGAPSDIQPERKGDIYLNDAHLARVNDATAVPFLKSELAKFGVEFES